MIQKERLEKLYKSGFSMMDISKRLGKSHSEVIYWMDKYDLLRRSRSEATYIKRNPNGDPFRIKNNLSPKEIELKGLGLGLFWGEGNKRYGSGVRLGNTDYRLIRKFIDFLTKICGVSKDKLRFNLQVFNDSDPKKALRFWIDKLRVNLNQFGKITIIPPMGKGTYKKKSKYGVLTVGCYNTKLKKWIDKEIRSYS